MYINEAKILEKKKRQGASLALQSKVLKKKKRIRTMPFILVNDDTRKRRVHVVSESEGPD